LTSEQIMTFPAVDPFKYLEFACEISSRTETEVRRTAGDRAYYAAFLFARDQLKEKGYMTPYNHEGDKKQVTEVLKRLKLSVGMDEFRLQEHRTRVTYHTWRVEYPSLEWMIDTAQKIINYVKALPVNPNIKN